MAKAIDTSNNRYPVISRLFLVGLTLSLGACGSFVHDSGPGHHVDVSRIQDPVPRVEPRAKYGNPDSYQVDGKTYRVMQSASGYHARGLASWYGTKFHGQRTSNGETYNMYAMTAAHKTLPIPVYVRVTSLENGRSIVVRVNDRGPFVDGRIIDLSYVAAKKLGIDKKGTGLVEVRALHPGQKPAPPTQVAETQPVQVPAPAAPAPIPVSATPEPAPEPAPVTTQAAVSGGVSGNTQGETGQLYLQVGAFTEHYNAAKLLLRLLAVTTENVIINRKPEGDHAVYRVRIGPLASESSAQQLGSQLSRLGITASHVVVD